MTMELVSRQEEERVVDEERASEARRDLPTRGPLPSSLRSIYHVGYNDSGRNFG